MKNLLTWARVVVTWTLIAGAMGILWALIVLSLLLIAERAQAFPEMSRHGYQSCVSCHVAPGGGGALTAYGRMISKASLSTARGCSKCRPDIPDWVDFGADYRYLNATRQDAKTRVKDHKHFPMQAEAELVLYPVKGFALAQAVGTYGPLQDQEYRRGYAMLTVADLVRVRAGKFLPTFGINDPDHTLPPRRVLGEEQYAAEASVITAWGEAFLTQGFGAKALVGPASSQEEVYAVKEYDQRKTYARLQAYLPFGQAGLSGRAGEKGRLELAGAQAFLSYSHWLYLSGEVVRELATGGLTSAEKLGVEPVQGLHVFLSHDLANTIQAPGLGLQWFPMPGVDLLLKARRELGIADQINLILHVYL